MTPSHPHPVTVKLRPQVVARPEPPPPHRPEPVPSSARALIRALIESMIGLRPLHQVRSHLTGPAFRRLTQHARAGSFRAARTASTRLQMPSPNAVEAVVRVATATRWLVCVIRLDHRDSWGCTEFAVLGLD